MSQDVPSSLQFSYFAEGVLVADSDYSVKCMDLTLGGIGKSRYLLDTSGPIMVRFDKEGIHTINLPLVNRLFCSTRTFSCWLRRRFMPY